MIKEFYSHFEQHNYKMYQKARSLTWFNITMIILVMLLATMTAITQGAAAKGSIIIIMVFILLFIASLVLLRLKYYEYAANIVALGLVLGQTARIHIAHYQSFEGLAGSAVHFITFIMIGFLFGSKRVARFCGILCILGLASALYFKGVKTGMNSAFMVQAVFVSIFYIRYVY